MRTFWISLGLFILFVAWLLTRPIEHKMGRFTGFSSAELNYVDQTFSYAMEHAKPKEFTDWSTSTVNGRIDVTDPFTSKSGSYCRGYTETYVTSEYEQILKGYGCKRTEDDGWCRLREKEVETCAFEERDIFSFFTGAKRALIEGEDIITRALHTNTGPALSSPGIPPINASLGMPSISLPKMKMPDKPGQAHLPMPWEAGHEKPIENNLK